MGNADRIGVLALPFELGGLRRRGIIVLARRQEGVFGIRIVLACECRLTLLFTLLPLRQDLPRVGLRLLSRGIGAGAGGRRAGLLGGLQFLLELGEPRRLGGGSLPQGLLLGPLERSGSIPIEVAGLVKVGTVPRILGCLLDSRGLSH